LFDEIITRDESFSAEVGFALKLWCESYHMQKDSYFKLLSIMRSQFYLQVYEQQHAPFITGNLPNWVILSIAETVWMGWVCDFRGVEEVEAGGESEGEIGAEAGWEN
jgi:hypothetical protein